jgi:hypothetical protein
MTNSDLLHKIKKLTKMKLIYVIKFEKYEQISSAKNVFSVLKGDHDRHTCAEEKLCLLSAMVYLRLI